MSASDHIYMANNMGKNRNYRSTGRHYFMFPNWIGGRDNYDSRSTDRRLGIYG